MFFMNKLENFKNTINQLSASCKEKVASYDESQEQQEVMQSIYSYIDYVSKNMWSEMQYLNNYIKQLESRSYEHDQNHLPKLTAGQMQKILDMCGASEDYEIKKPSIYMSSDRNKNLNFIASYHAEKNNQ